MTRGYIRDRAGALVANKTVVRDKTSRQQNTTRKLIKKNHPLLSNLFDRDKKRAKGERERERKNGRVGTKEGWKRQGKWKTGYGKGVK